MKKKNEATVGTIERETTVTNDQVITDELRDGRPPYLIVYTHPTERKSPK